ncbi:hypothetical protein PPYR_04387 [Photinus pyralis]|uniref:Uncharacterized protein n=1 Tax=Photinus pyralis TaxID=7054 RepID=A0A5N4AXX1_PHOPY|nr:hypothetical protein PPYR_04387 [Photinus pyralis]
MDYEDKRQILPSINIFFFNFGMIGCLFPNATIRSSSEGVQRHDLPPSEMPWVIAREHMDTMIPSPPRFPEQVPLRLEPNRIAEAFAKSSRILDATKLIRKPPQIREPSPDNAPATPVRSQGVQSIASVSRILDSARSIPSHLRSPEPHLGTTPSTSSLMASSQSLLMKSARHTEPSRNIKSPIPRIIQAMTSKARRRYESLKLIERMDRISPKSWL